MVRRANAAVEEAYPSESETAQETIQEQVIDNPQHPRTQEFLSSLL